MDRISSWEELRESAYIQPQTETCPPLPFFRPGVTNPDHRPDLSPRPPRNPATASATAAAATAPTTAATTATAAPATTATVATAAAATAPTTATAPAAAKARPFGRLVKAICILALMYVGFRWQSEGGSLADVLESIFAAGTYRDDRIRYVLPKSINPDPGKNNGSQQKTVPTPAPQPAVIYSTYRGIRIKGTLQGSSYLYQAAGYSL